MEHSGYTSYRYNAQLMVAAPRFAQDTMSRFMRLCGHDMGPSSGSLGMPMVEKRNVSRAGGAKQSLAGDCW